MIINGGIILGFCSEWQKKFMLGGIMYGLIDQDFKIMPLVSML